MKPGLHCRGIAEAYYGELDPRIKKRVKECLSKELWQITEQFRSYLEQRHAHTTGL
ncbi:MAG: hypothetical protein JRI36_12540 [Deltaproteobacteria bacterium]|nr:hypothetical protein [Deltaproteobacteria bacterium]